MDIYEYIKMDHKKVDNLFCQLEQANANERQQIMMMISRELLVHTHSEHATFYKALAKHSITKAFSIQGEKEHHAMEEKINDMLSLTGKKWEAAVIELKEMVSNHVKEEEEEVFKYAKMVLSTKECELIKQRMQYLKDKFLLILEKNATESGNLNKKFTLKPVMTKGVGTNQHRH